MHCRCKLNLLHGYCRESDDSKYFIGFIAPCRAGISVLCGEPVVSCPAYVDVVEELRTHWDDYSGMAGGDMATNPYPVLK